MSKYELGKGRNHENRGCGRGMWKGDERRTIEGIPLMCVDNI